MKVGLGVVLVILVCSVFSVLWCMFGFVLKLGWCCSVCSCLLICSCCIIVW